MMKLEYYVSEESVESTIGALFAVGAGKFGNYDHCCWVTEGIGQFRPLAGSQPFCGRHGELERGREMKVELVFADELKAAVIAALRQSHPYETPAYQLIPCEY
jgi:hypothetical protein